jgi:hypothetical protein
MPPPLLMWLIGFVKAWMKFANNYYWIDVDKW